MQRFHEGSAPHAPHHGFNSGIDGGGGASSYPPLPLDSQSSPRISEEYVVGQQQQPHNSQHAMMPLHTSHAALMQGFGARGRGSGDVLQAETKHGGSSNSSNHPLTKEMMDYYFFSSGKDGQRRGSQGAGYGTGVKFPNLDGHMPHLYQPSRNSGPLSGMSRYQMDYGATAGSGGRSNNTSGAEAFSPTHQYVLGENHPLHTAVGTQLPLRYQNPNYSSHQTPLQAQHHRGYAHSGHRLPPSFSHFPPNVAGPSGAVYNSPTQTYHGGRQSNSFEYKVKNSTSANSNPSPNPVSANQNNLGQFDNAGRSFPGPEYLYSSEVSHSQQSHSLHPHHSQQNLGASFDASHKVQASSLLQQPGLPYSKHTATNKSSSSSVLQFPPQELTKPPVHSQTQPNQFQQNFSPISNPSPAASVVQSPSCSSSPSPLTGIIEVSGSSAGTPGPPLHLSLQKTRTGTSQNRLLQVVSQLSPTANSNSSSGSSNGNISNSISSTNTGGSHSQTQIGPASKGGVSDTYPSSSPYPSPSPHDKPIPDPSTNSLNALSSQVANLQNTVQQMLVAESRLSHKKGKDDEHDVKMQQSLHSITAIQQRHNSTSVTSRTSTKRGGRIDSKVTSYEGGTDGEVLGSPAGNNDDAEKQSTFSTSEKANPYYRSDGSSEIIDNSPSNQSQFPKPQNFSQTGKKCHSKTLQVEKSKLQSEISSISTPKKTEQDNSLVPCTSSLSSSCHNLSTETSRVLSPTCLSPMSLSMAESSNHMPFAKPNIKTNISCNYTLKAQKEAQHELKTCKIKETEDDSNGLLEDQKSDICGSSDRVEELGGKQLGNKKGRSIKAAFKEKEVEIKQENHQAMKSSDEQNHKIHLEEFHIVANKGVIVTARSDTTQAESAGQQTHAITETCNSFIKKEFLPHSSFVDSSRHNGESEDHLPTNLSHQRDKIFCKQSLEQWTSLHGYSDFPHATGIAGKNSGKPVLSEGRIESNAPYQGYPSTHYSSGLRKRAVMEGLDSKDLAFVAGRGHANSSSSQQQFPSLLQEVLQGYHPDKRYGTNPSQQFQMPNSHNASPITQHYSHYRQPQSMLGHIRLQQLVPQNRMNMEHCTQAQTSSEKLYSPKGRPINEVGIGQNTSLYSWSSMRSESKVTQWTSPDKNKTITSSNPSSVNMQQSTDQGVTLQSKHINLADYSVPSRKSSINQPITSSAVQQLLLQDSERPQYSGMPLSSERRSVICDVSPSHFTASERHQECDKGKDKGNCLPQSGCSGASVIQQSVNLSSVMAEQRSTMKEMIKKETKHEELYEANTDGRNKTQHSNQSLSKAKDDDHHTRSSHISDNTINYHIGTGGQKDCSAKLIHYSLQDIPQNTLSNLKSSPSTSKFQSYFQGSDASNNSAEISPLRFREPKKVTTKMKSPQHFITMSSTSVVQNSQSPKRLSSYLHSHSVQYPQSVNDHHGWPSNSQPSSKDMQMFADSCAQSTTAESRSLSGGLANQQQFSSHRTDLEKKWNISDKESERTIKGELGQRQHYESVVPSTALSALSTGPKQLDVIPLKNIKEEDTKPLHQVHNHGINSGGSGTNVSSRIHGKPRGPGDANPLMMRRRVRSFISPIPPKRQTQDTFLQQQRGTSAQQLNVFSNSASRPAGSANPPNPDSIHLNQSSPSISPHMDSLSQSNCLSKTKILPPRKGRGLKLEAIVQKITPSVKKATHNTDPTSNHLYSFSHSEMTSFNNENQPNASTTVEGNFSRTGSGSSLPYLNEGLLMDDITFRGVEETGPPPPTAYPCDPQQDPHLKCDVRRVVSSGGIQNVQQEFRLNSSKVSNAENDSAGDVVKDELSMATDFTLLGPLPPPPPLPCRVQASPPPSASALSDMQHFTTTYQQLETRRGEHSAAHLLRQNLQDSGMAFSLDNYTGKDYLETKSHHEQNLGHYLLSNSPHVQLPQHQHSPGASLANQPFSEQKHDNAVPKGYFPSGKKKGRPVGSVNKQKRSQAQSQNVSVHPLPVASSCTPVPTTPPTEDNTDVIAISAESSQINTVPSIPSSPTSISQSGKADAEIEETEHETELKSCQQRRRKREDDSEEEEVDITRQKTKAVMEAAVKDDMRSGFNFCHNKSVFSPYIHVERKVEEVGNVCTIVNGEDERKRVENNVEDRGSRENYVVKESEKLDSSLIQSSPTGKTLPSSGYVLPGPVIAESNEYGRLLCCLCKKWANYKDLGDLYGPYYPPDYSAKIAKNPLVNKQGQGTARLNPLVIQLATNANDVYNSEKPTVFQENVSMLSNDFILPVLAATQSDTTMVNKMESQNDSEMPGSRQSWDFTAEHAEQQSDFRPQQSLLFLPEDIQKRPQHRKLTSHPRFKRRHKSSEDLPKAGPTNNKALLPFQPPPPLQLFNQDTSNPLAALSMLPQVPLDPEELWVHEGCIVWASGVFLVNGRLYGLQEALDGAKDTCCSFCKAMGSTLGCYSKGCTLRYHYLCAMEAECSLNEDNFSLRCPKHKQFTHNNRPTKVSCVEQPGRG